MFVDKTAIYNITSVPKHNRKSSFFWRFLCREFLLQHWRKFLYFTYSIYFCMPHMRFFSSKKIKRWFTLIEMLIVIVIIGILAAALIPRLASARGRANDVARKADLQQTAVGIVAYQIDHGEFPACGSPPNGCPLSDIETDLVAAWMSSIPTDPTASRKFDVGMAGNPFDPWQFGYTPIKKWWIDDNGFVLMAAAETEWWSNRVATAGGNDGIANIDGNTDAQDIILCKSIEQTASTTENNNGVCKYEKGTDVLRYIYVY